VRGALPIVASPRRFFDPRPATPSLLGLSQALGRLERHRPAGLLVEILPVAIGWATAHAIHARLRALRDRGMRVVAWLPQGGGTKELYLAAAASEAYLATGAPLWAAGLRVESSFLGRAFERFGLRAQIEATGDHKSAGDRFTRSEMSDADRQQLSRILDVTWERVVGDIADGRKKTAEEVRAFFDAAPQGTADAVAAGLFDAVLHEDELHAKLSPRGRPRLVALGALVARRPLLVPLWRRRRIAVVPIVGPIVPAGALPAWASGASGATADAVVSALRAAARDRSVVGVVLAIDSPGGSATASEAIHREVVRVREKKPVVASMGDVAASGGYYVAVAAETIFASRVTITGSIGVVGGKIAIGGLLEKLGVHREMLTRGARAALLSPSRAWTDDDRAAFRRQLERTYDEFVGRVADGRKKSPEEVRSIAGGRVWVGADALANGLVDREGDLGAAIDLLREKVGRTVDVVAWAGPSSPPPPLPAAAAILATERIALFAALDASIEG